MVAFGVTDYDSLIIRFFIFSFICDLNCVYDFVYFIISMFYKLCGLYVLSSQYILCSEGYLGEC